MAELKITVSTLPAEQDSFLPRHLIVQLLDILARTPEANPPQTIEQYSAHAQEFIETFKSPLLFTPLTFSIFWHDNVAQVLAENPNLISQNDQYNRAPLTLAIANEDFILADKLVKEGAVALIEDKLMLEITLTSMIQSNISIIDKILATAEENSEWLAEYLQHLKDNITGESTATLTSKYHEVINPQLRNFGQLLDTFSYFNGLPSHYGFLSPSLTNLTNHLQEYRKELASNQEADFFNKIFKAYSFFTNTCKYHGNLPTEVNSETAIAAQIIKNINNDSFDPVVVFGGWAGNAIAIAFVNKFLIFSNLGVGGNPKAGTKIYPISKPDAITPEFISTFMYGLGLAISPNEILAKLSDALEVEHIYTLVQKLNPIDNCIFVNPRAIIEGILLLLSTQAASKKIDYEALNAQSNHVNSIYNSYVNSLHQTFTKDLTKFMRNHEQLKNKRIECCSLALDYINQHYNDPAAIERCIELKNALEFVGLKGFYMNNIAQDAKEAILDLTIKQQEATAMQVIEQEYAIAAAQGNM